jgi:hypothetical protein
MTRSIFVVRLRHRVKLRSPRDFLCSVPFFSPKSGRPCHCSRLILYLAGARCLVESFVLSSSLLLLPTFLVAIISPSFQL